jgi:hypothetical protein
VTVVEDVIANIEGTIKSYTAAGNTDMVRYWTSILERKKALAAAPKQEYVSRKQAKRNRKEAERYSRDD